MYKLEGNRLREVPPVTGAIFSLNSVIGPLSPIRSHTESVFKPVLADWSERIENIWGDKEETRMSQIVTTRLKKDLL